MDEAKLHQFMGQMLSDLGGAASVALVRIGDALGLYKILHERGLMTVVELAAAAGVNERYLREWLSHQAASNYVAYDPATQKFTLPPEQAMVFAIEDSPVYMPGAFDLMTWMTESTDQVEAVFKTGSGVPWSDHTSCFFCAVARFFRPGYHNNLVQNWLPTLDGVVEKLKRGARVADVGCGHGWSAVLMPRRSPTRNLLGTTSIQARLSRPWRMLASTGSRRIRGLRSRRPKDIPGRTLTSSRSSTVCTTWVTQRVQPRMSDNRSNPTVRG